MSNFKSSFPPLSTVDSTVLILGSLPGDRSLALNQYYGHPQNRFWKIVCGLYGCEVPDDYQSRKSFLQDRKIAVWDVAATAVRQGSLDSNITDIVPNDLDGFLTNHPAIRLIVFNGKKAEAMFNRFFKRKPEILYVTLPSSSPANASKKLHDLVDDWRVVNQQSHAGEDMV